MECSVSLENVYAYQKCRIDCLRHTVTQGTPQVVILLCWRSGAQFWSTTIDKGLCMLKAHPRRLKGYLLATIKRQSSSCLTSIRKARWVELGLLRMAESVRANSISGHIISEDEFSALHMPITFPTKPITKFMFAPFSALKCCYQQLCRLTQEEHTGLESKELFLLPVQALLLCKKYTGAPDMTCHTRMQLEV